MKLVNLTPHSVTLIRSVDKAEYHSATRSYRINSTLEGDDIQIIPSSGVSRCNMDEVEVAPGFFRVKFGKIDGLPDPEDGVMYIVSRIVMDAAHECGRDDVCAPHRLVRDVQGNIIGCLGFSL